MHSVERTFRRPDGSRVRIVVAIWCSSCQDFNYRVAVHHCLPGKRSWLSVVEPFSLSGKPHDQQDVVLREAWLLYCTPAEIDSVLDDAWHAIAPRPDNTKVAYY